MNCKPLALLAFLAILVPPASWGQGEPARHEATLKTLRERIVELDREQRGDRQQQDRLGRDIETAERKLATSARALRLAETEVSRQRREVETAQTAQTKALAQAEARREDLARALRASYMAGDQGALQLLFRRSAGGAGDRLDADAAALAGALQQQVRDLQTTIEQLRVAETVLKDEQALLEKRQQDQQRQLAQLQRAQKDRRTQLDRLRQRTQDRDTELARTRAEQSRLEKLLEQIRQALRDSSTKYERGTPFRQQRGRLPWPMRGKLLAEFGTSKGGGPLTWSGWWIEGPAGAAVRAVADARVVYVGWVQRYGQLVILDHPGAYLSLYGHLQEAVVEVGETVSAGTQLGTAGNSGGHDRTGVYFEIREGTNAVNPRPWLTR